MGVKFIIQVKTGGKWKAVHKGDDPDKAVASYRISFNEVGGDNVRALEADGTKEDGTTKWIIAEIPDQEIEPDEVEDDVPLWQSIGSGFVMLILAYQFVIWVWGDEDENDNTNLPIQHAANEVANPKQIKEYSEVDIEMAELAKGYLKKGVGYCGNYLSWYDGKAYYLAYINDKPAFDKILNGSNKNFLDNINVIKKKKISEIDKMNGIHYEINFRLDLPAKAQSKAAEDWIANPPLWQETNNISFDFILQKNAGWAVLINDWPFSQGDWKFRNSGCEIFENLVK